MIKNRILWHSYLLSLLIIKIYVKKMVSLLFLLKLPKHLRLNLGKGSQVVCRPHWHSTLWFPACLGLWKTWPRAAMISDPTVNSNWTWQSSAHPHLSLPCAQLQATLLASWPIQTSQHLKSGSLRQPLPDFQHRIMVECYCNSPCQLRITRKT